MNLVEATSAMMLAEACRYPFSESAHTHTIGTRVLQERRKRLVTSPRERTIRQLGRKKRALQRTNALSLGAS
jgi:hypothetical protein